MIPIAHIENDFPTKFGIPRQSGRVEALKAKIVFEPEYRNVVPGRRLEEFQPYLADLGVFRGKEGKVVPDCPAAETWGKCEKRRFLPPDLRPAKFYRMFLCEACKGIPG